MHTKNTLPNHQEFNPQLYGVETPIIKQTPKTPKPTPSLEASNEFGASKENLIQISQSDFQILLTEAAKRGAKIALKEVESNKRHILFTKYRLTHVETAKKLGVSANTLLRNRDLWCLEHYTEGNKRYYTSKSIETYIENRS